MTSEEDKINKIRVMIDEIDLKILSLIESRASEAAKIGTLKRSFSKDSSTLYRPEREADVIRNLVSSSSNILEDNQIKFIFKEIISACLATEEKINVAFLGPKGTYSDAATLEHFGSSVSRKPQISIEDIFTSVEGDDSNFGIVPFENSTEGVINTTLNCLADCDISICGELYVDIIHNLAIQKDAIPEEVSEIVSHPQALGQCSKFLSNKFPNIKQTAVSSSAEAASLCKNNSKIMCIASKQAILENKLSIVASSIQDFQDNKTRFLIIGRYDPKKTDSDKTSFLVRTENIPGALYSILEPFKNKNINLHRIETRPSRKLHGSHDFFIDTDGHHQDENMTDVIKKIKDQGAFVKILGSYPQAL